MSWLLFYFAIEFGAILDSEYSSFYPAMEFPTMEGQNAFYIEAEPEVVFFDFLHLAGIIHVDMFYDLNTIGEEKLSGFAPVTLSSQVNVFIEFQGFIIGAEWVCRHPVIPWGKNYLPGQKEDSWFTSVYVRYDSRLAE